MLECCRLLMLRQWKTPDARVLQVVDADSGRLLMLECYRLLMLIQWKTPDARVLQVVDAQTVEDS